MNSDQFDIVQYAFEKHFNLFSCKLHVCVLYPRSIILYIDMYVCVYYVVPTEEHHVRVFNSTRLIPDRIFLIVLFSV